MQLRKQTCILLKPSRGFEYQSGIDDFFLFLVSSRPRRRVEKEIELLAHSLSGAKSGRREPPQNFNAWNFMRLWPESKDFAGIYFFVFSVCICLGGWFLVRKPIILREKVEWERFLCDDKEFVHNASFAYPLRSLRMKCWTWDLNFRQKTAFEPLCWCAPFKEGSIETAKEETIRPQKLSPFNLALA